MIAVIGVILVPITVVTDVWRSVQVQTISIRLDSSGTVTWGDEFISIPAMQSELSRSARLLHSHGFPAKLLIESYSDVSNDDVETLRTIGRKTGFELVEATRLAWPSPAKNQ
jgi:hypothetical protein